MSIVYAQTTQFTYQGKLTDSGNLANSNYDFQFKLFDTLSSGTQQGMTQTVSNVTVTNGIFSVNLDFGACASCFNGAARFLEIAVRPSSGGSFTTLSPRQQITSTPYALKSLNSTTADGLSVACINCVTSSQIGSVNGSAVTGTIPVASVPAGSTNYIQNATSQQAGSNFNISGNGTAGTFNATTQYNFGGSRILSAPGTNNLFAGVNAGAANTSGCCSTFFGFNAGAMSNANDNSFFGNNTGAANTSGFGNSFFGSAAGIATNGPLFTAYYNSFFGVAAGQSNTTGVSNTIIGAYANVGTGDLINATAIGAGAVVSASNSLVLGNGTNVGIGTSTPSQLLHVNSANTSAAALVQTPTNAFAQYQLKSGATNAWIVGTQDNFANNALLFRNGGSDRMVILPGGNVGVGTLTPSDRLMLQTPTNTYGLTHTDGNITVGTYVGSGNGLDAGWYGTRSNHPLYFFTNNSGARMTVATSGNVGIGTTTPTAAKLQVNDSSVGTAIYGATSTGGSGVFGESTGGGYAMYASGNTGQARDKGGWVKALAFVGPTNNVVRCYNAMLTGSAASTPPCGFQTFITQSGNRQIDFGFQVNDRFVSVTLNQGAGYTATFLFAQNVASSLIVVTSPDNNASFMIIVH